MPNQNQNYVSPNGSNVIRDVLLLADPRPEISDSETVKIQYAVRFADHMATRIAADLTPYFDGIAASTKRTAGSVRGVKQLDVNFSTPALGMALGISLKSVHIRDVKGAQRYTHNMKRNEEELRIEASGYHKRQPYAVMIGVLFLPFDSCDDGKRGNPSSFGSWVRHLRPYAGRKSHEDEIDKFEEIYIGLYMQDGSDLRFFNIQTAPPKNSRPSIMLSYSQFISAIHNAYQRRNSAEFKWADEEESPLCEVAEDLHDDTKQES